MSKLKTIPWVQAKGNFNRTLANAEPSANAECHHVTYDYVISDGEGNPTLTVSHANILAEGFEMQVIVKKRHVVPVLGSTNN